MDKPKQASHLACRQLGERAIILDLGMNRLFHELNETGTLIWNLADGDHSISQITDAVQTEFETPPETAEADVRAFLNNLVDQGLAHWTSN